MHQVVVGGLKPVATGMAPVLGYSPESITAAVGDMVIFEFMQKNHTATQSTFAEPCKAMAGGMDSGFMPNPEGKAGVMWNMTVATTEPLCKSSFRSPPLPLQYSALWVIIVTNIPCQQGSTANSATANTAEKAWSSASTPPLPAKKQWQTSRAWLSRQTAPISFRAAFSLLTPLLLPHPPLLPSRLGARLHLVLPRLLSLLRPWLLVRGLMDRVRLARASVFAVWLVSLRARLLTTFVGLLV
jgi:hypothetical protein